MREAEHWVTATQALHFVGCVLLNKIMYMHVAAADPNEQIVAFFNFDEDASLSKLVNALRLTKEQDFHVVSLGVLINKSSQRHINVILLLRYVNRLLI